MNLLKRVIIAVIFIPLLLWIYYKGEIFLLSFLSILSVLSAYELKQMLMKKDIQIMWSVIPLTLMTMIAMAIYSNTVVSFVLFLGMIIVGAENVFYNRLEGSVSRISGSLLVMLYGGLSFGMIYRIHLFDSGAILLPLLAVLIWITDTMAYAVGMTLGRHRGIFKASPKKSIEGFMGGIFFALLFSFASTLIFKGQIPYKTALILGLSVGIVGQFGDLFESVLKRDFGVKDSSNLIPGHGGILDRFDSLMIAGPVFYILMILL